MAYKLHKDERTKYILVFDFGGFVPAGRWAQSASLTVPLRGTLDVSLLYVNNMVFEVVATHGDQHLGGEDFNHNLMAHFTERLRVEHGLALRDKEALQRLRTGVEQLKRDLSGSDDASLRLELPGAGEPIEFGLTRSQFEEINADLFRRHASSSAPFVCLLTLCLPRALVPVEGVPTDYSIAKAEVDEVVLVGGSSRIPRVRQVLSDYFGKAPNLSINPEEAVAIGASMQAGILTDSWPIVAAAVERVRLRKGAKS